MTAFPLGYHETVPLEQLHESPWNPRKTFDPAKLAELAESLKEKGCLTPLIGRPGKGGGVEIGAGHRRRRAAELAQLPGLPVVVRALTDLDLLELLVIENDQRDDVHELEQADGYKRLMLQDGYSAKRIADKVGRSEKYIYDRVKLLNLIPLGQRLFLAGKMTAGHAILIARLTKEQQERILGVDEDSFDERHSALFLSERGSDDLWDLTPAEEKARAKDPLARYEGYKPVSVRELGHWIDEHVRLDAKKVDPFLFPAVITAVEAAPKDLVPLTREHFIPEEARDGKVRTYGPASWKDVGTKPCRYTQPGIIVVGEGRGQVLQVCLSSHRDQCAAHWSKESKDAAARRKQMGRGGSGAAADVRAQREADRENAQRKAQDALRARWKLAGPAIFKALGKAVDAAPLRQVGAYLLAAVKPYGNRASKVAELHPLSASAEGIVRHAVFSLVFREGFEEYRMQEVLGKEGKRWGVDVAEILERVAPAQKEEVPKEKAKAKPKAQASARQAKINKAAKKAAKK